jgi:hypothetical protein
VYYNMEIASEPGLRRVKRAADRLSAAGWLCGGTCAGNGSAPRQVPADKHHPYRSPCFY